MCLAVFGKLIDKENRLVDFKGIKRKVNLSLIKDVKEGDFLLVHAGFAIQKKDKETGKANWELIECLNSQKS